MGYDYITQVRIAGELKNINTPANDMNSSHRVVGLDDQGREIYESSFESTVSCTAKTGWNGLTLTLANDAKAKDIAWLTIVPDKSWAKISGIQNEEQKVVFLTIGGYSDSMVGSRIDGDVPANNVRMYTYWSMTWWTNFTLTYHVTLHYALKTS